MVRELAENGHNMSMVARRLGISRSTLYRKMKQYELVRRRL
jgi:transcriptional regulator of acetoin/glycerol metabolism